MSRSLQRKMILSYLAVAIITVLVVSLLIYLTSGQFLMNLVMEQQTSQLKETVQDYYTSNGTLEGFFDYYMEFNRKGVPSLQTGAGFEKPPPSRDMRGVHGLVDIEFRAILPTLGYEVGEIVPENLIKQKDSVMVNDQTIAWILPDTSLRFQLSAEEQLYLQRSTIVVCLAAFVGVLAAVVIGFFLAGRLLKPIRLLTQASQSLANGNFEQQVPVTSQDELGLLTRTFNQMSADLAQADQLRKRMTADITHDLSTPIQIISGYIEMLEEGEVTLTPQRLEIIKTEIEHLRRLVGDLTTLSQVEAGGVDIQLQLVHPASLLEHVFYAYHPITVHQEVELKLNTSESTPAILVDEGRMTQVLKNLIENALRYTPKGGTIELGCEDTGEMIKLFVKDSGSGIDVDDLPFVFDRFYRADKARSANMGKMGLGLAICKALVLAQGGNIFAESLGKNQGTTMLITFPYTR